MQIGKKYIPKKFHYEVYKSYLLLFVPFLIYLQILGIKQLVIYLVPHIYYMLPTIVINGNENNIIINSFLMHSFAEILSFIPYDINSSYLSLSDIFNPIHNNY